MAWRVALFVGVVLAVGLMAGSLWVGSIPRHYPHGKCLERSQGTCAILTGPGFTEKAHPAAERYLRWAAGGVLLITLASLPMLGAGRRRPAA